MCYWFSCIILLFTYVVSLRLVEINLKLGAFDYTLIPSIVDTFHIIRLFLDTQFIQYANYVEYAFLLLLSIYGLESVSERFPRVDTNKANVNKGL